MTDYDEGGAPYEEGHFIDPITRLFRRTYQFSPRGVGGESHSILWVKDRMTAEDSALHPYSALYEGKPGICAYLWTNQGYKSATMFPLTPLVNGIALWGTTCHSVDMVAPVGAVLEPLTNYERSANFDQFALEVVAPVKADPPTPLSPTLGENVRCPYNNESTGKFDLVRDYAILRNCVPYQATALHHFWIPDPTPLVKDQPIALFGCAHSAFIGISDGGAAVSAQLFQSGSKSVSCGKVVGAVNQTIVCHNASTCSGFCGAPGVAITAKPKVNSFQFIHMGTHDPGFSLLVHESNRHNHGLCVTDPYFKDAYIAAVIPHLCLARDQKLLSADEIALISAYVPSF